MKLFLWRRIAKCTDEVWKNSPIIIEDRPDGTFWLVLRAQDGYYEVQVERRVDAKQ